MDKKRKKPMKMFDFFNPESPPIIIDNSPPAPSMLSSSCFSNVASINDNNERKNGSQEEVLSPRLRLPLNSFPTQACINIKECFSTSVRVDDGSNQHQETAPTTLQGNRQKPVQSISDETRITRVETKRSTCSVAPRKNKQPVPRHEEEEKDYSAISTELVLYEDPWKVKKKLKPSDLGHSARLLFPRDCLKIHVLQWMGAEMSTRVHSPEGMEVAVRDVDTGDEHRLVFHYWASSKSYVLNGDWNKQFVKRRGLKTDDEIGMFWDTNACMFHFTVLRKVACGTSNAAA